MYQYFEELTDEINKLKQKLKEERQKNDKLHKEIKLQKRMHEKEIERINRNNRDEKFTSEEMERICSSIGKRIREYTKKEIEYAKKLIGKDISVECKTSIK